jgi:membrane protease YdiL (CAAX protease family)
VNSPDRPRRQASPGGAEPARVRGGNAFGLAEAALGILAGFLLASLAVSIYSAASRHGHPASQYGEEIVSLCGLWVGFVGAAVTASRLAAVPGRDGAPARGTGSIVGDYGLVLHPWPDIPVGIVAGVASQYLLVPAVEAPLVPFVHNLYSRLSHPAQSLTGHAFGPGLVVLSVLVCVGSPVVEELFFRGLLLRALLGKTQELGRRAGPAVSIGLTALVFALAHFEALQFLGLAAFGVVLGYLAWRTGRLGPSIVAHMAFNTVTIIAIVAAR